MSDIVSRCSMPELVGYLAWLPQPLLLQGRRQSPPRPVHPVGPNFAPGQVVRWPDEQAGGVLISSPKEPDLLGGQKVGEAGHGRGAHIGPGRGIWSGRDLGRRPVLRLSTPKRPKNPAIRPDHMLDHSLGPACPGISWIRHLSLLDRVNCFHHPFQPLFRPATATPPG